MIKTDSVIKHLTVISTASKGLSGKNSQCCIKIKDFQEDQEPFAKIHLILEKVWFLKARYKKKQWMDTFAQYWKR